MLADTPAIKRLEKHADQRVVSIQYVSKAFAKSLGSANKTMEDIAGAAEQALEKAEVSEEQRKQIVDDIRGLNLARYMPEPGDTSGVAFLTDRGYEGFQYNDGKRPMMDSSKPLTILSHVGGSPLLLVASRSKQNIQDYEEAIAWLKKTAAHVEKIAEEKSEPDEWAKYQEIRKRAIVLLERLDKANREHLYPALADGQGAFVLDLEAKSKQWFKKMPESPKPLPMFELAFVGSVSDAERLRQGVAAYIDVAVEAYKLVKEFNPKEMPELKLPKATVSEISGGGKLYSYPLPKKWGVDPQVAVNAGLTDKFVAVSTMPKTTERLLQRDDAGPRHVAEAGSTGGDGHAHRVRQDDRRDRALDRLWHRRRHRETESPQGRRRGRGTTSRPRPIRSCCNWASSCRRFTSSWMLRRRCAASQRSRTKKRACGSRTRKRTFRI